MGIWVILLQLFGPLLVELLRKLFDKWFSKAAESEGVGALSETKESQLALIDETLKIMPRWRPVRRALLRNMREAIEAEHASPELIADTVGWLGAAVDTAENE